MPRVLIVEDGTNVANCNSYATLDQIKDYNAQRGVTLPDLDDDIVAQAVVAMDYLATYEQRLSGKRTFGVMQRLAWPRTNVVVFDTLVGKNIVPPQIVDVQCYLAGVAGSFDLYGNQDTRAIIKDTTGPLDTEYAQNAGAVYGPVMPTVAAMMRPFLQFGGPLVRTVRA